MSAIRLQDVTKTYSRPLSAGIFQFQFTRGGARRDDTDAARADQEGDPQAGHGDRVVALDGVNLAIPDGQTLAVVGPSGCGKSTLLRVVAGLEPDYSGSVLYDGQDMREIPPKDRYIGMVFQNYALYPHFMGRGNLSFFFKMRKISDQETEERIRITSEIMGIGFGELLKRKPGVLSGGQQQRVAIARAIVRNPRLFLFDEPLSNLDAKLRVQTRIEIRRLLRRFQITAIYVTHDQVEAITLGDRVAVMRAGQIEQVGTYHELRHNPANTFVAGFLGRPPMNLFTGGTVVDAELRLGPVVVPLPDAVKARVHVGQAVTLGVRPEAAHLVGDGRPPQTGLRLRGTVDVVEPDFERRTQWVYMHTGALFYAVVAEPTAPLSAGSEVEVVFPADRLHFFDGGSGRSIG